jgi:hypothetical protein
LNAALKHQIWDDCEGGISWEDWEEDRVHLSSIRLSYVCSNDTLQNEEIVTTESDVIRIWNKMTTVTITLHKYAYPPFRGLDINFYFDDWKILINPQCEACFNGCFSQSNPKKWGESSKNIKCLFSKNQKQTNTV